MKKEVEEDLSTALNHAVSVFAWIFVNRGSSQPLRCQWFRPHRTHPRFPCAFDCRSRLPPPQSPWRSGLLRFWRRPSLPGWRRTDALLGRWWIIAFSHSVLGQGIVIIFVINPEACESLIELSWCFPSWSLPLGHLTELYTLNTADRSIELFHVK